RAAMPAAKSAAAAPSIAPLPPPATSCRAPSASPPPGRRESTSATPKGSTDLARRSRPSILEICVRSDSMADLDRKLLHGLQRRAGTHVLSLFLNLVERVKMRRGAEQGYRICPMMVLANASDHPERLRFRAMDILGRALLIRL